MITPSAAPVKHLVLPHDPTNLSRQNPSSLVQHQLKKVIIGTQFKENLIIHDKKTPQNMTSSPLAVVQGHADDLMDIDAQDRDEQAILGGTHELQQELIGRFRAAREGSRHIPPNLRDPGYALSAQHNCTPASAVPFRMIPLSTGRDSALGDSVNLAGDDPTGPFENTTPGSFRYDLDGSPLPVKYRASRSGGPRQPGSSASHKDPEHRPIDIVSPLPSVGVTTIPAPVDGEPATPAVRRGSAALFSRSPPPTHDERSAQLERKLMGRFDRKELKWLKDEYEARSLNMVELTAAYNERHLDDRTCSEITNALSIVIEWEREATA